MVGAEVVVLHRLVVAPLGAGVAVVLHVALGAHHAGVGLGHDTDLSEVAEVDHVQVGGAVLGEYVTLGILLDRLDQRIAHHAGLGPVRVVAVDAPDGVVGVLGDVDYVGGAVPLGPWVLLPHELPLQEMVGGLALDAGGVAGHGALGELLPGVGQDIPGLAGGVDPFPPLLELEAPSLEAVHHELVDHHEGVPARLVMLEACPAAASGRPGSPFPSWPAPRSCPGRSSGTAPCGTCRRGPGR